MVKTVNATKLHDANVLNDLFVTDLNGDNAAQRPNIITKEDLFMCEDVPTPELANRWKHLNWAHSNWFASTIA